MPANFVVQRKIKATALTVSKRKELDNGLPKLSHRVWVDTVWSSLALARERYPQHEFREVMTQW